MNFTDPSGHGPCGQPVWDADLGRYVDPVYEQWAAEARARHRPVRQSKNEPGFWQGYWYCLWNPSKMDADLRAIDKVAKTTAVVAGTGAVGAWAWGVAGRGQFAVGVARGAGYLPHFSFGWGAGGSYTWAHGLGPGLYTTTAFVRPGVVSLTGIPIVNPGAIGAWVATQPDIGDWSDLWPKRHHEARKATSHRRSLVTCDGPGLADSNESLFSRRSGIM